MQVIRPFGVMIEGDSKTSVNDLNLQTILNTFHNEKLVVLRGFKTFSTAEEFAVFCASFGEISLWPFGKVLELIEQDNPQDHIFDNNYVPLHWDGMYREFVPEFQIFHCVKAPVSGQGGNTTFTDTVRAIRNASPKLLNQMNSVIGTYQRKMEFYDSKTISPVLMKHPYKNFNVIRYNEPPLKDGGNFLNPPDLNFSGIPQEELEEFHDDLRGLLYHSDNFYSHEWRQGDIIIADNFTLLHGRDKFQTKAPRHLQRVHVLGESRLKNPGLVSSL